MTTKSSPESSKPASVFRRFAAFIYDCLLICALFFFVTAVAVRLNDGEAIEHSLYKVALVPLAWIFFGWFWINGGQTLGMRAWRIKLVNDSGESVSVGATLVRFCIGLVLLPVVLLPAFFDKTGRGLHDRVARTRVISTKEK